MKVDKNRVFNPRNVCSAIIQNPQRCLLESLCTGTFIHDGGLFSVSRLDRELVFGANFLLISTTNARGVKSEFSEFDERNLELSDKQAYKPIKYKSYTSLNKAINT